jgi:PleD family two-component response regulator
VPRLASHPFAEPDRAHRGFRCGAYTEGVRLLFAEDDTAIREYVARGLRESGYAVDAVANGEDALLAAATVSYDLAILDIAMPRGDGLEVCRQLRVGGYVIKVKPAEPMRGSGGTNARMLAALHRP